MGGLTPPHIATEEVEMRLVLNPDHERRTIMGYHFIPWVEPVSYGYDSKGHLESMVFKAPVGNSVMLNTVGGDDLVVLLEDYIVEEGS